VNGAACLLRSFVVLAAIAVLPTAFAPFAPAQALPRPGFAPLTVSLDWKMQERFGLDLNGNQFIDVWNTPEYVRGGPASVRNCATTDTEGPPTFCVELFAHYSALDPGLSNLLRTRPQDVVTTYRWQVFRPADAALVAEGTTTAEKWVTPLGEGRYRVQVDLTLSVAGTTETATAGREIQVDDILIVSMGDSLSSGEGNPERASIVRLPASDYPDHFIPGRRLDAVWADDGSSRFFQTPVSRDHHRSHRSTVSWPAQAALAVEQADPRTSVTFVHVAASGATIRKVRYEYPPPFAATVDFGGGGLLVPYEGIENVFGAGSMRPQVNQVASLLGCLGGTRGSQKLGAAHCDRQIDALTISIGINDILFSTAVTKLVDADGLTDPLTYSSDVNEAIDYATRGLALLPGKYDELAGQIRGKLDVFRTYLMQYPDPTGDLYKGEPVYCDEIVGDVLPPLLEIDTGEQKRAEKEVLIPLNNAVGAATVRHDWVHVGGIAAEFGEKGRGYCAPAARKWFRTATESAKMQGPDAACALGLAGPCNYVGAVKGTKGTLHPDAAGHRFLAKSLLARMILQSSNSAAGPHENDDQLAEAVGIPVTQPAEKDHCEYAGAYPCALFNTDVDIYRVAIPGRNQRMTFRAEPRSAGLKPQLRLFDAAGTDITKSATCVGVSSSAECPAQVSSFTLTFREAGTYYVGVSAWGNDRYDPVSGLGDRPGASANLYSLRAFTIPGVPDNTLAHATPVSLDERVEGYAVETWADVDMFRFHADSAGDVHVDVKSSVRGSAPSGLPGLSAAAVVLQPGRFSARLFDRTGNELARGEEPFTHRLPRAGDFYLGVASPDATYDPTVGIGQPAGQGRPPGAYVLNLTRGASPPQQEPEPAPAPAQPEQPAEPEQPPAEPETPPPDRTLPPRPETAPNRPPVASDGHVKLRYAPCERICVWYIWFEPGDVIDPEGDAWAVHSWNHARRRGSLSFGDCGYDEHGCFRYSTFQTTPYEDAFTYQVWDPNGSGRSSEKATVTLCVNCR